jgi:O-antigen/teichoic acid export membrane protein
MTPLSRGRAPLSWLSRILRQPLFANAGYLWGVTLIGALTGFFFWGLAARFYAPEEVGIASAVISAVALLAGIAGLGVGTGLVRFLPAATHPLRLLNTALTFTALVAFLVAAVYLAGLGLWSPSLALLRGSALAVAGFLTFVVAQTLDGVLQMAFVARRRAGFALAQTLVINGGRLLLVVPFAGMAAAGLVGSVALALVLAVVLSLALFLPRVEPGYRPRPRFHRPDLARILPYSFGNYLAQLLAPTSLTLLPILVLELLGAAPAGHLYIAWMLGSILVSPGVALATSAFAEGSNAPDSLSAVLSRAAAAGLALTAAGALAVALGAPWLLRLFGPEYAKQASALLRWLAAAAPFVVLAQLYFTRLRVQKRIGRLVLLSSVIAVCTLALATALMPHYGIAASAVGWLLGNGLVAAIALFEVWRGRADRTGLADPDHSGDPVGGLG